MSDNAFSSQERAAVYRAIAERRDMRHFSGGTVAPELLARLLEAAHQAPSVGLMQPWRFIRITNRELRAKVQALVEEERVRTAQALGERSDEFMTLKVEGINDCAEVLVAALMDDREKHIFGRRTLPEMDMASLSCAIKTCGWRPGLKGWAWAGCRCSSRKHWRICWACLPAQNRWRCCAWGRSRRFIRRLCWCWKGGRRRVLSTNWCTRTIGG